MNKTAIVIGAGVGGLAAAIRLARAGVKTTLHERAATVGGRLREIEVGGRKLDAGPSVLTMKWVFDELFDGRIAEYLELAPLEPLCRHFFADGSRLDLFCDEEKSREAIRAFAGARNAEGYSRYRKHAAKIFDVVRGPFMENALPSTISFLHPKTILEFTRIDGMRSLWKALGDFFPDERLRVLFGRYATYNGSSPFHAPATLAVIAHVENAFGIFACKGGIYRLADALARRAVELGVEIRTNSQIDKITIEGGRAVGVRVRGSGADVQKEERADVILCNADAAHAYGVLLREAPVARPLAAKYGGEELSLSAYVLLAVGKAPPIDVIHHNVFFSPGASGYEREFEELVKKRQTPSDPTVYLCAQDRTPESGQKAPGLEEERLFFLSNAPPLEGAGGRIDWMVESGHCRERIQRTLARHGWTLETSAERALTPVDWDRDFPSSRGAIYGLASNSKFAAFSRPPSRVAKIPGLYLAGGSVHPGAGMPMVALSAKIAVDQALAELRR